VCQPVPSFEAISTFDRFLSLVRPTLESSPAPVLLAKYKSFPHPLGVRALLFQNSTLLEQ
jgi:hypothetical protein